MLQRLQDAVGNRPHALSTPLPRRYRAGVDKVRPADVQAAAQRRLHPAQQTVVVAGDAARLRPELEALGMPIEALTLEP